MLLGHARGKVGDLVFSRVNGQQVARARAAVVKNPQTESQMIQRIILNTVSQAYSRMSEICDHSFEGVPTGQKSMAVFMKRNMSALRQAVSEADTFGDVYAFAPVGTNEFCLNEYVIASGSLPSVTISEISALTGAKVVIAAAGETLTYQDVINGLGLQRGDQLTFIGQQAWTDHRAAFKFCRVILDPTNIDGTPAELSAPFLSGTAINLPSPRNEGEEFVFGYASGSLSFNLGDSTQFGAAVIVSRQKSDGTWMRSNTSMTLVDGAAQLIDSYSLQDALDLFASGAIDLTSDRYLNNARRAARAITGTDNSHVFAHGYYAVGATDNEAGITDGEIEIASVALEDVGGSTRLVAIAADGTRYLLYNGNSYSGSYGGVMAAMTGYQSISEGSGWARATKDNEDPAHFTEPLPMINLYGPGEDNYITDDIRWLISQGVDVAMFVNVSA